MQFTEVRRMTTGTNGVSVEVEQLEPQPVVSIRAKALVAALGETMGERFTELSRYLAENGVSAAGPAFVRYHTFEETETDVETGFPVVEPAGGEGRILAGDLPGGSAISTWHDGPDHLLGEAYARLGGWLQEHHHEAAGPGWEVYLDRSARCRRRVGSSGARSKTDPAGPAAQVIRSRSETCPMWCVYGRSGRWWAGWTPGVEWKRRTGGGSAAQRHEPR